ncbi:hypothetical protein ACFQ1M_08415 [Sungkyunkwania multivorans]|uniref:Uncharacterized protein n=1 Tax=Sungkyunkwania multivorans TaxID=1173618 RepID=A0ABW3CZU2_9FLAO
MLDSFKTYLQFGPSFCGVEHTSVSEEGETNVLLLNKKKDAFEVEREFTVTSLRSLKEELPKGQHISLVINNQQVLSKRVDGNSYDPLKIIHKAFPNINLRDFYYEISRLGGDHLVSICRKEYIDSLIHKYQKEGFYVLSFSLGLHSFQTIASYINVADVAVSNYKLSIEDDSIIDFEPQSLLDDTIYDLGGIKLYGRSLLSFAAVIKNYSDGSATATNNEQQIATLKESFFQNRLFSLLLKGGLGFLFVVLLINFFIFGHYNEKVNELTQSSQVSEVQKEKLLKLNEKVQAKQRLAEDILASTSSKSSFYLDEIASILPSSMVLDEINYQPLSKRIKEGQKITFQTNEIIVSGKLKDNEAYTEWFEQLEQKPWVNAMAIQSYGTSSGNTITFTILISIGDE